MSSPTVHECPDGSSFRIGVIQTVRDDPLFDGERLSFRVEPEQDDAEAFTLTVEYSPIYVGNASPQDRLELDSCAEELVEGLLDEGQRQSTRVRVGSDGAVKVDGRVVRRLQPLRGPA